MKVTLFIISLYIFVGCEPLVGYRQASNNIKESKKNGVFIREYKMKSNPYSIGRYKIYAKEIWLEYRWSYDKEGKPDWKRSDMPPRRQLLITLNKPLKGFDKHWSIGDKNNYHRMFRNCSDSCIMTDLDEGDSLPKNQFVWDIYAGEVRNDTTPPIIGKFELFPK
jgi:hypothetical protein